MSMVAATMKPELIGRRGLRVAEASVKASAKDRAVLRYDGVRPAVYRVFDRSQVAAAAKASA
jgi:hypothetical protein